MADDFSYEDVAAVPQAAPAARGAPGAITVAPLPNVPGYVSDPSYAPPQGQQGNTAWQTPAVPLGGPGGQSDEFSYEDAAGPNPGVPAAGTRPVSQSLGFMEGLAHPMQRFMAFNDATLGSLPVVGGFFHSTPTDAAAERGMDQYFAKREQTQQPGAIGRFGGETVGTLPFAGLGPMTGGAVSGALLSDAKTPGGVALDTALGAFGGKVADAGVTALKNIVAPEVSAAVRTLMGEKVRLTAGQILGGGWQRLEDGATSIPVLGDVIKNAQARSVEDFNRAAINRSLSPIGQALPDNLPAGYDAVDFAHRSLGDAYDKLLPGLQVRADPTFQTNVANLRQLAQNLTPDYAKKFETLLQNEVEGRFAPQTGVMTGQSMKEAETALGQQATRFGRIQDGHAQDYADAVRELQAQLRELTMRSNPQAAKELQAINSGWANLVRVENAASRQGATGGVFTPSQLQGAVRATDNSVRKSATARGNALMQDLSTAGKDVLPSKVPDSGSPFRHLLELTVAGLVGQEAHMLPMLAKGAALGGVVGSAYTKAGQKVVTPMLTARPAAAKALARQLPKLKVPAIAAGGAVAIAARQAGSN